MHAREREAPKIIWLQCGAPSVEDLHSLCTGIDLRIEIFDCCVRNRVHKFVEHIWRFCRESLDSGKTSTRTTFDHVGADGERAARETAQRYIAIEFTANRAHCIENVAQLFFNIRDTQVANRVRGAYRIAKFRPLAGYEVEAKSHGVRNRQNIGKQYCGIQIVTAQRL